MRFINRHTDSILKAQPAHRLLAVDVFRGLTITAMILVNNPGSWSHIYAPLKHADWHGWTATDLIFPFFIFIVGISITLSVGGQLSRNVNHKQILIRSSIRMLKLFLLGWFLALFYYRFGDADFNWVENRLYMMRIMGVLQRIGLVYFITVIFFIYCKPKSLFIWALALLIAYTASMLLIPYMDASGETHQGLWNKGNNLSAWLDHNLLGANHVYNKSMLVSFDPEGILSSIPAIVTCLSGVLVGLYLKPSKHQAISLFSQVKNLSLVGLIGIISGELLDNWIPINKALWTASYVLLSSGFACLILALCIYLLDIKKFRRWSAPFVVFGANAIAFFMFSGVVGRLLVMITINEIPLKTWLYRNFYQPVFGDLNGSLAFALSFLLISYLVMLWMFRRNIFWKV